MSSVRWAVGLGVRRVGTIVAVAGVAIGAGACGSSGTKPAAVPKTTTTMAHTTVMNDCASIKGSVAHVGGYTMVAVLGPAEMMYTQAQVAKDHPKTGEVMLSGQMMGGDMGSSTTATGGMGATTTAMGGMGSPTTSMGGMGATTTPMTAAPGAMNGVTRHLEVHVCSADGKVVTNAHPSISLKDSAGGMTTTVPVATMQGIDAGTSDFHYGNNVSVTAGHDYVATVTLGNAVAHFTLMA